jgi:cystathionine beta-lyase/cystathionine gamma-synthase
MQGACGLLTFIVKAERVEQIENFCYRLQHILMAVSWGGHESLIVPKCAGMPAAEFDAANPEHRMIRMYVGLEEADYLIKDLERGFGEIF